MVWRSADGEDWLRATAPPYGSGSQDLLTTADGYVLAAGFAGEMDAAFSSSTDGLDWTAAPDDPSFANAQPTGLAMLDGTIVAVGLRMTPVGFAPTVWVSTDGRAWTPVPDTPALSWWPVPRADPGHGQGALQGSAMWAVQPAWSGLLAVGSHWRLDPSGPRPDGTYAARDRRWDVVVRGRPVWELLPDELVSISVADFSSLQYGLGTSPGSADRPLIVGTTPEDGPDALARPDLDRLERRPRGAQDGHKPRLQALVVRRASLPGTAALHSGARQGGGNGRTDLDSDSQVIRGPGMTTTVADSPATAGPEDAPLPDRES